MISYIESSVILSLLLEDEHCGRAVEIWTGVPTKITSIVTKIESKIVLRRFYALHKNKYDYLWLNEKESILTDCRSLDAIHVGVLLHLKRLSPLSIAKMYSFDNKILEVAKKMNLL